MEILGNWGALISIISSLTVGGIISNIITLKYVSKKEAAKAQQERETAEGMDIDNTSKLITLYKGALDDARDRHNKAESELKDIISKLEDKVQKYESEISNYQVELEKCRDLSDQLIKSRLKLKSIIQSIDPSELKTILQDTNINDEING